MKKEVVLELSNDNVIVLKYDTENPGMIEVSYKNLKNEILFGIFHMDGNNPTVWMDYNDDYIVILREKRKFKNKHEKHNDSFVYKPNDTEIRIMFSIKDEKFIMDTEDVLRSIYEEEFHNNNNKLKRSLEK